MRSGLLAGLVGLSVLCAGASGEIASRPADRSASSVPPRVAGTTSSPWFEPAVAEPGSGPRFVVRARDCVASLCGAEAVLLPKTSGATPPVVLRWEGAGKAPVTLEPAGVLPGVTHEFLGRDPARWRRRVPHFRSLRAADVAPGVEIRWVGDAGRLAYELHVAPGADPASAALAFPGASGLSVDRDGALLVRTAAGVLRHSAPRAWQETSRGRAAIAVRFVVEDATRARIVAGRRDPSLALVVDPRLEFSTFLGGRAAYDQAVAVAVDAAGVAVVVGQTHATDFPTKDALQGTLLGNWDATVTRLDRDGSLLSSTFLGGSRDDVGAAVSIGPLGEIVLAGQTGSADFPTVSALQTGLNGPYASNVAVLRLSNAADEVLYSTYLGGSRADSCKGIGAGPGGSIYVAGQTTSTDFPTVSPVQSRPIGSYWGWAAKIAAGGASLDWLTWLGGSATSWEGVNGLAVDGAGRCVVVGTTYYASLPVVSPWQAARAGSGTLDAYLAVFSADQPALDYLTYYGGTANEYGNCVAVDPDGSIVIAGSTNSPNLPIRNALESSPRGSFVARFVPDGTPPVWATYLGGTSVEEPFAVGVDATGDVTVAGRTRSGDFPTVRPLQATLKGAQDVSLARIAADGSALRFGTYLGGAASSDGYMSDHVASLAMDGTTAVLTGWTDATDFPVAAAFQASSNGLDGFVVRVALTPGAPKDLAADVVARNGVLVSWTDGGDGEGFDLERRIGGGSFESVATLPPGTTAWTDSDLAYSTSHTYRVRAFNEYGTSAWSEAGVATAPPTPEVPTGLVATVLSARSVRLDWTDASPDETAFEILRSYESESWEVVVTADPDATSATDGTVLPDRDCTYLVRAVNAFGPSPPSNAASALTPASLVVEVRRGRCRVNARTDTTHFQVSGVLGVAGDPPGPAPEPTGSAFAMRLGGWAGPVLVSIPEGSAAWRRHRTRRTWRSARGADVRVAVTVDLRRGTFRLSADGIDVGATLPDPVRICVLAGDESGSQSASWREGRHGLWTYRVAR